MKNKTIICLLAFVLSLALVACGGGSTETANDAPSQETAETAKTSETENGQVQENPDTTIDESLEGEALVASLSNVRPDKLMLKATTTAYGMTTQTTTYYDGENTRTETDMQGVGKSILISLPEQGIMYSYIEGNNSGVILSGTEDSYDDEGMADDTSMVADIIDNPSQDIVARADTLNGEDVVYIETTESDEDMGEILVKMWYSVKYAVPLKYEMYMGGQLMSEYEVTEISDNVSIDSALFQPPADVDFQEANIGGDW